MHIETPLKRLAGVQVEGAGTPLLQVIANNPRLVDVFRHLTQVLVKESQLDPQERWLVTMRMAWRCGCHYEFGRKAGDAPSADAMKKVTASLSDPALSQADRLLLEFTDQVHARQQVDQGLWDQLAATRSPAYLVELTSLAGLYLLASSVANVCGDLRSS